MKQFNKQILEAIRRGVNLALDDYEEAQDGPIIPKKNIIKKDNYIKNIFDNFVDLGLPSGTLWGRYNLGVDPKKLNPKNLKSYYGNYYAFGEIAPKKEYTWETYKFFDRTENKSGGIENHYVTKYNSEDKITQLQKEDNIAQLLFGNSQVNLPTPEQVNELIDNTTLHILYCDKNRQYHSDYVGYEGVAWLLVSDINGNSIFFPHAGVMINKRIKFSESPLTGVWTNHISMGGEINNSQSQHSCADCLVFNSYKYEWAQKDKRSNYRVYGQWKFEGLPIRPVFNN